MKSDDPVTRETVERLCALADLPLAPERRARLVPMLSGLIATANDLNRKMAAAAYRTIVPILRFPERSAARHRTAKPAGHDDPRCRGPARAERDRPRW